MLRLVRGRFACSVSPARPLCASHRLAQRFRGGIGSLPVEEPSESNTQHLGDHSHSVHRHLVNLSALDSADVARIETREGPEFSRR